MSLVPVVTILVEGDRNAITEMYHDLKNDIPVVIIGVSSVIQGIIFIVK